MKKTYDVAAYIWPSYHPDDRAKIFWPMGIGEWETVMNNKPKFEGHDQPRFPVWGYGNEADRYVMQMQIDAAYDHGVNVFIYDWYWYDGMPYLEGCLNDGYMKANNNDKVKFYIMWANHDVNMLWDKRNCGLPNNSLLWTGGVDRPRFEQICHRMIEKYFCHPSYYKINNKPVFMLYELATFIKGIGGIEQAKSALDWFKNEVIKAGYPGLELQLTLRKHSAPAADAEPLSTQSGQIKYLNFDSATHYQFVHMTNCNRDYNEAVEDVLKEWELIGKNYDIPYYPHVSVGWDSTPRFNFYNKNSSIIKNNTPENFAAALLLARDYIDTHPSQAPLITLNSWNEWTETSYLQPCTRFGYGYLEACKRVFK